MLSTLQNPNHGFLINLPDAGSKKEVFAHLKLHSGDKAFRKRDGSRSSVFAAVDRPEDSMPTAAPWQAGAATLPRIREGWLELSVEPDAGPPVSFIVPVTPRRTNANATPAAPAAT